MIFTSNQLYQGIIKMNSWNDLNRNFINAIFSVTVTSFYNWFSVDTNVTFSVVKFEKFSSFRRFFKGVGVGKIDIF